METVSRAGGAALVLLAALAGCSATIGCPPAPEPSRAVFLLDHGRHTSLVVANEQGRLVRYAYGDWRFYAEDDAGIWQGAVALLVPSRAGLGRRHYEVEARAQALLAALRSGVVELHRLEVSAQAADALHERLDGYFVDAELSHYNARFDLEFVPHPQPYAFWRNSNHKIAEWLRRLDCGVRGPIMLARWELEASVQGGL